MSTIIYNNPTVKVGIAELELKRQTLKRKVENRFGGKISSSRGCINLCDQIFKRTNIRLNPNTMRRYYGIVKTVYPPSRTTLNILSKYCGYSSLDKVPIHEVDSVLSNLKEHLVSTIDGIKPGEITPEIAEHITEAINTILDSARAEKVL